MSGTRKYVRRPAADPLLRVGAVAAATGLSVRTIYQEVEAKLLPCVRVGRGRHRMFQWSSVVDYCRRVGLRPRVPGGH